ncbi:MAG: PspC domain-containing protein [Candidatus Heimdallarchaeota archaeon]|nr:MAG: PspC domain-containing protein [Candidatus Heimdallarchaeota archaeon]
MAKFCDKCGEEVSPDDLFCNNCGSQLDRSKTWAVPGAKMETPKTETTTEQRTQVSSRPKRFYRSREDRWIAGVCGGLGEYFNIDPILVRLGFIFITAVYGVGILVYILLAIFVEENPHQSPRQYQTQNTGRY